jgi:hypothetical protein
MHPKEAGLTGLALALLAYWKLELGAIPLGLFTLHYLDHPAVFSLICCSELLLASLLLYRATGALSEALANRATVYHDGAPPLSPMR